METNSKVRGLLRKSPLMYAASIYVSRVINRVKAGGLFGPGLGPSTGGATDSARYCYSVWLRHLCRAFENGFLIRPDVVAELGPGNSIGVGLAALISGASKYYALDTVKYSSTTIGLSIFDELVHLFVNREDVPANDEFPELKPVLKSYKFPKEILDEALLKESLEPQRIKIIRRAVEGEDSTGEIEVKYFAPWTDPTIIPPESLDLIFSQAVLEHVQDLDSMYRAMYAWLKPGGWMSHQIDFRSHGKSIDWNGHWVYPEYLWKVVGHNYINRQPLSRHLKLMEAQGFSILPAVVTVNQDGIQPEHLAGRWRSLTLDDLHSQSAFIQCQKK